MASPDPLAQLRDIHLPEPIGWWPLAIGWYILIALGLLSAIIIAHWLYKKHRHALPKKQALRLLNNYIKQYEQERNGTQTSARISELLRRVALVYFPRERVASLHGEEWLKFLDETGKEIDFNRVRDLLLNAPFKTNAQLDLDLSPLFSTAKLWIKQRRTPCSN